MSCVPGLYVPAQVPHFSLQRIPFCRATLHMDSTYCGNCMTFFLRPVLGESFLVPQLSPPNLPCLSLTPWKWRVQAGTVFRFTLDTLEAFWWVESVVIEYTFVVCDLEPVNLSLISPVVI